MSRLARRARVEESGPPEAEEADPAVAREARARRRAARNRGPLLPFYPILYWGGLLTLLAWAAYSAVCAIIGL